MQGYICTALLLSPCAGAEGTCRIVTELGLLLLTSADMDSRAARHGLEMLRQSTLKK